MRMELAAALHHSSFRGAGPEMYDAPRRQRTANSRVGPAEYYELSSDDGRPTGGERPEALSEPWPQGKLLRHAGVGFELVQALDAPVLQTVEQLLNVVQFFSTQLPVVAEPVIAVPKILPHDVPPRRLCRVTQLAEQLVEVPTPVSYSSLLQRIVEQHVDIPVPLGGGRNAGLQGFLPEQSSTFSFSSSERISERIMEQIVDNPASGGGLQGFRPGQSSSASFSSPAGVHDYANEPGEGVFRTFPRVKKSPKFAASPSPRVPASGSSWTRAAYGQGTVADDDDECVEGFFEDDAGNVWTKTSKHTWLDPLGQSWLHVRRPGAFYWWNLDTQHTQWLPPWDS